MTTIDFPKKGRDPEEPEAGDAELDAELELEAEGEALDLDVDDAEPAPAASRAAAAPPRGQGAASIGLALLLIVSLAAVAVLWKQRGDLQAQVAGLETALAEAGKREARTQATVGDVAKQLEAIQTVLGSLLSGQAADEIGSETEAAAAAAEPQAPAAPAEEGWVDRALQP